MSRTRDNKEEKKSPSTRLRAVFYLLWEKDNEDFEDFEEFYDSKMEKLIVYYKKLLK